MTAPTLLVVVNTTSNYVSKRRELAQRADDLGLDVHLATPDPDPNTVDEFVTLHSYSLNRRSTNPIRELRSLLSFIRLYRRVDPDIVHHYTIKPITYGSIAARVLWVPIVVNNVTGLGTVFQADESGHSLVRWIIQHSLRFGANRPQVRFIFQNPDDAQYMKNREIVAPAQSSIIRSSGVRVDQFEPTNDDADPPLVVLPARMLWAKGIEEFVAAAQHLEDRGVEARFALVGDTDQGNPDAIPQSQLEAWDDDSPVEWWGWCEDMQSVYAEASVVCLPSYYPEGVPQVLLEAAASQLPTVTTDMPGCREAVIHGETGFIVPPRDATKLGEKLRELIENPELRRSMGANGRALVEAEFSRSHVVNQTIAVYQELLDEARAGH